MICTRFLVLFASILNQTFKIAALSCCRMKLFVIGKYFTYMYSLKAFHWIQIRQAGGPFYYFNVIRGKPLRSGGTYMNAYII